MMKKRIIGIIATVIVVAVAGIFYACEKKKEDILLSEVSNREVKSFPYDDILTNSVSIDDFPVYLHALGEEYQAEGWQGYLCFSRNAGDVRYGYVIESNNEDIYNYLNTHFAEIMIEDTYGENWKDFDDLEEALDWLEEGFLNYRTVTVFENKDNGKLIVILEQKNSFIIITDEEREYLEAPMSVDEFDAAVETFIEMATVRMDCYFVVAANADGMIQNTVLGVNTSHSEWYNRLSGYFEIAEIYPYNPDEPLPDGGCIVAYTKREVRKLVREAIENGKAVCVEWIEAKNGWYVCVED